MSPDLGDETVNKKPETDLNIINTEEGRKHWATSRSTQKALGCWQYSIHKYSTFRSIYRSVWGFSSVYNQ
jgi:hypothetical protein